ncbi:MAG: PP2C family protein-serine/threonine phosphatase, partial [Planctomycetota bacterium]
VDNWPKLDNKSSDKAHADAHNTRERNKKRLQVVERAVGLLGHGVVRGFHLRFTERGLNDRSVGASLAADAAPAGLRQVGSEVYAGTVMAQSPAGGAFRARVYQREYKTAGGLRVGDAFVILSEDAIRSAGGGGTWLILTPLLVGAGASIFVLAAGRASAALRTLARDLDALGRGRFDLRTSTGAGGEVGYAQRVLERVVKNLQLIQTTGSGDLDEALEKELGMAAQIHQSLRPQDPPRLSGYELETLFKPGRDIGGDYFDYVDLDENRFALVIADGSESLRGVPAAMVMAMTRAYLKSAIDPATGPGEWLKKVNRRLSRDLKAGMAVTALVVVLSKDSGEVVAASAGHRPIVLWRQGKTATVNPNGIALGLDVGPVFDKTMEEKRFTLQANDRLVVHTDGVISAANAAGEAYGEARFLESVRKQGGMNSAAFVNFAGGAVDRFLAGSEQNDDITICTIKRMR